MVTARASGSGRWWVGVIVDDTGGVAAITRCPHAHKNKELAEACADRELASWSRRGMGTWPAFRSA